jgi:vacuolar protein sorting-associated protein 13A/C
MVVSVSSTFYNPKIAVWEPIIEKTSFAIDMSLNAKSNPKKYIILEMNSPQEVLNINISA